jgi:hypothetical protein
MLEVTLIDQPILRQEGETTLLLDKRLLCNGQRVKFWGLVILGASVLMTIIMPSWRSFDDPSEAWVPIMTLAVGAMMVLLGGRPGFREVPLCRLMPAEGIFRVYPYSSVAIGGAGRDIWLDEIKDLLFGLVRYPLDPKKPEVTVEAFTLCLRLYDGSVVPVVEATPDKLVAYQIGQVLSQSIQVPLFQTGLGI